jgi:glutamate/tyrosine decarboxylase-like PLP-dependent enzyme
MNYNIVKNKILNLLNFGIDKNDRIRQDKKPQDLINEIDFSINKEGESQEEITLLIDQIVSSSVNTDHPFFMNQMYGKQNPVSVYGDILTTILNTSMYTYEVAPVMTLIEKECIAKLCTSVWNNRNGDGIFTPGGSISNMMAIMLARNSKLKTSKKEGLYDAPKFSIFTSDQAHYSFLKGAVFMGFGKDSIVKIDTNEKGEIIIDSLLAAIEKEKQNARVPLMLVGVAGTTFSGVYDDLETLADIAEKNNMWYHVDAVYGGSLLFSEKEQNKFTGIKKADSVSWNLHKMMGVPLICSTFLTKQQGLLNDAFAVDADYLFHKDEEDYDLGQKSLQCGRRVDALKLWLAWKHDGEKGFENRIERLMKISSIFADKINSKNNFELLCQPQSPVVIFRILDFELEKTEINMLNKIVRDKIFKDGEILFNYSEYKNEIYMRCVISDPELKEEDIDKIISKIQETLNFVKQQIEASFISLNV